MPPHSTRALVLGLSLVCTAVLTFPCWAHAQVENVTDPTEPTSTEPLVAIPMPGQAASEPEPSDAGDEPHSDKSKDEPVETSVPGDPWGDSGAGGLLSLRVLFQMRYTSTFAVRSMSTRASVAVREENLMQRGDGYDIKRLFVRIGSDPSPYLGFKAVFDFAQLFADDPEDTVKQAYANLRPIPKHLELMVGLFKQPFSTLELDPSSRWEFADLGDTDRLITNLGYAGRDLGLQLLVAPLKKAKRLRITVGAFRGHTYDEHDLPFGSFGGRIETKPNKHLRFGADVMQHTREVIYNRPFNTSSNDRLPDPLDPLYPAQKHWGRGRAYSGDFRYKHGGLMLRGEVLYGDRVDINERYGAETFLGAWGVLAYNFAIGRVTLVPAIRYEWLDANRENEYSGIRNVAGAALSFLFLERMRLVIDVTRNEIQSGTPRIKQPKPLPSDPYMLLDHVRGIVQMQIEL